MRPRRAIGASDIGHASLALLGCYTKLSGGDCLALVGTEGGCYVLGVDYANGLGTAKDEGRAAALCRKACDGGEPRGCYNLGVDYAHGRGVPKDEGKATALLRQACAGGFAKGCDAVR